MDVKSIYIKDFTSVEELERYFGNYSKWRINGYCDTKFIKYKTKEKGYDIDTFYYFNSRTGISYIKPNTDDEKFKRNGITMHSEIKFFRNELDIQSIYDKGD